MKSAIHWPRLLPGITLHCSRAIPKYNGAKSIEVFSRLRDKANAVNLAALIEQALAELSLDMADICGITTDGCPVMEKLGRKLKRAAGTRPFYHQLCLAHGLHLAVKDTFSTAATLTRAPADTAGSQTWRLVNLLQEEEREGERF